MSTPQAQAILVLPHLRVQNANAISSPLTHGFPSITAFMGLMWALQRKLAQQQIPLRLLRVGVICHHHQEQTNPGYVRTFNLTRNPVDKDGSTAAIVEEGRMHLRLTLVFSIAMQPGAAPAGLYHPEQRAEWASQIGQILANMRVAGGTLLPSQPMPGQRVRPWLEPLADTAQQRAEDFRRWRRQWLPGFALVARDDVLADRLQHLQHLQHLRAAQPDATLLDAWLHAARFNYQSVEKDGKVRWEDPLRGKGSGWLVPIPVGYAALTPRHDAGSVRNARDTHTSVRFVESVYSIGEWVSPHRLGELEHLLWWAETDEAAGLYRCRNAYQAMQPPAQHTPDADDWMNDEEDEDDFVEDD